MSKRAVIFVNGELADLSRLKIKKTDLLIGVDGGTKLIKKPELIIGDLDSIKRIPRGIKIIKKPDQEQTDTEMALEYCRKQKIKEVILVGLLGRRLDHLLANIMNLIKFKFKIIEGNQEISLVTSRSDLEGSRGDLVSLIPILSDCNDVTTKGLKWSLQGRTLKLGESRGVSNVMLSKTASVSLKKGCLLVVKTNL